MSLNELIQVWQEVKDDAEHFCFVSADETLQARALANIETLIAHMDAVLENAIRDSDQPDHIADSVFCLITSVKGVRAELKMWTAIRSGDYERAWDHLITAQGCCEFLLGRKEITRADRRLRMLLCLERILFPPQMFMSPGVVGQCKCTICGQDPQSCDHIKGRLYRGKLCRHEVTSVDWMEVSLTFFPADKRRRILSYSSDAGPIDKLTNGPKRPEPANTPDATRESTRSLLDASISP